MLYKIRTVLTSKLARYIHIRSLSHNSPEPAYERLGGKSEEIVLQSTQPFDCQYGGRLHYLDLAYESWGELNAKKDNTVLLIHGLSASAHAHSKLGCKDSRKGWWENFIGPGLSVDTDRFFVVCVNLLGSCFGTTGPSNINPKTGKPYGGDFPIVSIQDMVRSQFLLLRLLQINKVHAIVGSSLGGLAAFSGAALYPRQIQKIVSISAGGCSVASAIAFRYLQRVALMSDPEWNSGNYYSTSFPMTGVRLARKIATLTYRSGPEWDERFNVRKIEDPNVRLPRYDGSEFLVEDYIRHQGDTFVSATKYDPNSLIYLSKAMDLFNMAEGYSNMAEGFSKVKCPTLILGASSDILYPAKKQIEAAELITMGGNKDVTLEIIEGVYGHDTFLLDVEGMGKHVKRFLEA